MGSEAWTICRAYPLKKGQNLKTYRLVHNLTRYAKPQKSWEMFRILFILGKSFAFVLIQCRWRYTVKRHYAPAATVTIHFAHYHSSLYGKKKRSECVQVWEVTLSSSIDATTNQSVSVCAPSIVFLQVTQPCQQPARCDINVNHQPGLVCCIRLRDTRQDAGQDAAVRTGLSLRLSFLPAQESVPEMDKETSHPIHENHVEESLQPGYRS